MFFAIINARKIPPVLIWRPGYESHPYELKYDVRGMPVVRARYDFLLPPDAHASASTGLYAVLQDASSRHFIPPDRTMGAWQHPPTLEEMSATPEAQEALGEQDDEEDAPSVDWDRTAITEALRNALDTPDELDLHEDYKQDAPMTKKQLRAARTKLCRILRKLKKAWFPAWSYAQRAGSLLSRHITPPKGCKVPDARHLSLDYPDLLELLREPELFYTALQTMAAAGWITVENQERGWIVSANDEMPMDESEPRTATQPVYTAPPMGAAAGRGRGAGRGMQRGGSRGPRGGYLGGFGGRGQRAYEVTGFTPRVTGEMEAEPGA
mmetsp:Transcript_29285/g.59998  ORF Transcript_29285/g.59998 Transcript_29285/m.59998 type:complete len:324 (-) Transcript_29285:2994-3965(-)